MKMTENIVVVEAYIRLTDDDLHIDPWIMPDPPPGMELNSETFFIDTVTESLVFRICVDRGRIGWKSNVMKRMKQRLQWGRVDLSSKLDAL